MIHVVGVTVIIIHVLVLDVCWDDCVKITVFQKNFPVYFASVIFWKSN